MFEVLSCANKDAARWQSYFDRLPPEYQDIMFTPAYARVQESLGQGPCFAAVYVWQEFFILQPFMLKNDKEIVSFYGGGGPISNLMDGAAPRLWLWFEQDFAKWRKDMQIVSEYTRLHPYFEKQQRRMLRESTLKVDLVREAVMVKLEGDLIKTFSRNRQRGIRGACGAKLAVEPSHDLDLFSELYRASMSRLDAPVPWLHKDSVWGTHSFELCDEYATFLTVRDSKAQPEAALLVLHAYGKAYAHFLGRADNLTSGALDLLYYESMKYCRDVGCQTYFLGGGTTSVLNDPLLAYKAGFSSVRVPVYGYSRTFGVQHADSPTALTA